MPRDGFSSHDEDWIVRAPRGERCEHYWQRLAALYAEAAERRLLQENRRGQRSRSGGRRVLRSVIARLQRWASDRPG
jgi:hypothetical protein